MELVQALHHFLMLDRAWSTRETYRKILTPFVTSIGPGRPLELIRPEDITAYVFALRERETKWTTHPSRPAVCEPLAPATVYKHTKTIRRFFNWCVEQEYLDRSPARVLSSRRPVIPLGDDKAATEDEVRAILHEVRKKPRDRAIVLLLVTSAARANEIASLKIRDLHLNENRAWVNGKGSKRREIFFLPETAAAIRAWLELRPDVPHDYVFTSTRGLGRLGPQAVSQITRRACRAADLERSLGAHAFRHYVGIRLSRQHVPLPIIQAWLGHSDPMITVQYLRSLNRDDLRLAGAALRLA